MDADFFEEQLTEEFTKAAFIDIWDEAMCFTCDSSKLDQSQAVRRVLGGN